MDVHIEEARIRDASQQARVLHEVWTTYLLSQRTMETDSLLGFTKTLATQDVSSTRLYGWLERQTHDFNYPGVFTLEGTAYKDLHAHGAMWVPTTYSGDWMYHLQEHLQAKLQSGIAGFSRVEWIRDSVLWMRYITKQVLTGDLDIAIIKLRTDS